MASIGYRQPGTGVWINTIINSFYIFLREWHTLSHDWEPHWAVMTRSPGLLAGKTSKSDHAANFIPSTGDSGHTPCSTNKNLVGCKVTSFRCRYYIDSCLTSTQHKH
jgi:hypothetical protein